MDGFLDKDETTRRRDTIYFSTNIHIQAQQRRAALHSILKIHPDVARERRRVARDSVVPTQDDAAVCDWFYDPKPLEFTDHVNGSSYKKWTLTVPIMSTLYRLVLTRRLH